MTSNRSLLVAALWIGLVATNGARAEDGFFTPWEIDTAGLPSPSETSWRPGDFRRDLGFPGPTATLRTYDWGPEGGWIPTRHRVPLNPSTWDTGGNAGWASGAGDDVPSPPEGWVIEVDDPSPLAPRRIPSGSARPTTPDFDLRPAPLRGEGGLPSGSFWQ